MCGITGIWHFDKTTLPKEKLISFNNSLKHRGPDGSGSWIDDKTKLGLAQRRLSILDLSENGSQPMHSANDRFVITFNGEIFNFLELRKELIDLGCTFKSDSDTEVILAAYEKWGKDCLARFNGMWAFAIYDKKERKLFLSRDRFGVKPLYYVFEPGKIFAFASETIAFKHLLGFKREIDDRLLARAVEKPFSIEGYGYTIFKNIFSLLGGHYAEIDLNSKTFTQKRWWSTLSSLLPLPDSYEKRVELFRKTFEDACRIRMRSDVSLGTALSGGVDSSAVYSTINSLMKSQKSQKDERVPKDWQKAFVETFPGTSLDERHFAEIVIKHVGGIGKFITPDNTKVASRVYSDTVSLDSIYVTPLSVVSSIYEAMRKDGVRVSLDGHGADEMLFGYQALMTEAHNFMAERTDKKGLSMMFGTENDAGFNYERKEESKVRKFLRPIVRMSLGKAKQAIRNIFAEVPQKNWEPLPYIGEQEKIRNLNKLNRTVFESFHLTTLPTILRNFDRASMQHGIEVRMPFMDYRLVSLVFSLSLEDKIHNGFNKRILRDSMKEIMPEEIRTRRSKIGLNAPMVEWFPGVLRELIMNTLQSDAFQNSKSWDAKRIQAVFEKNMSKNSWNWNKCVRLWPYINAAILLEENK